MLLHGGTEHQRSFSIGCIILKQVTHDSLIIILFWILCYKDIWFSKMYLILVVFSTASQNLHCTHPDCLQKVFTNEL